MLYFICRTCSLTIGRIIHSPYTERPEGSLEKPCRAAKTFGTVRNISNSLRITRQQQDELASHTKNGFCQIGAPAPSCPEAVIALFLPVYLTDGLNTELRQVELFPIPGSLGVAVILYTDDTDFTDSHRKSP